MPLNIVGFFCLSFFFSSAFQAREKLAIGPDWHRNETDGVLAGSVQKKVGSNPVPTQGEL